MRCSPSYQIPRVIDSMMWIAGRRRAFVCNLVSSPLNLPGRSPGSPPGPRSRSVCWSTNGRPSHHAKTTNLFNVNCWIGSCSAVTGTQALAMAAAARFCVPKMFQLLQRDPHVDQHRWWFTFIFASNHSRLCSSVACSVGDPWIHRYICVYKLMSTMWFVSGGFSWHLLSSNVGLMFVF